jgi:hypothetical protein
MRIAAILLLIIGLSSCSSNKKYKIRIDSMDPETKYVSEKVIEIHEKDDTSAFKTGHERYWVEKLTVLEVSKKLEKIQAMPFYFSVERENGTVVNFDSLEAERLTAGMNKYVKEKALPEIDTITPISKMKKSGAPNIY